MFATKDDSVANGFVMNVRNPNVIIARGRDEPTILEALQDALTRQRRIHPDGRIFIVRTHMIDSETRAWSEAFRALGVRPREVRAGEDPLLVIDPSQ